MSKVKIQGNASGTGVLTVEAPNTNTDRTITLPDGTGTLLDTNSSLAASKLTGALPAVDGSALTGMPAGGKVLQVVQAVYTSTTTLSTSAYVDTGLTATITPSSATSKILVLVTQHYKMWTDSSSQDQGFGLRLMRDASVIVSPSVTYQHYMHLASSAMNLRNVTAFNYLDSPATTAARVYKTTAAMYNPGIGGLHMQGDSGQSTITLVEIGA